MKKCIIIAILFIYSVNIILSQSPKIQLQNTIGTASDDYLYTIQQTADGGYFLGGHSGITGTNDDMWPTKLLANGSVNWQDHLGGTLDDWLYSIEQTSDNGYILGGLSYSGISGEKTEANIGSNDYWIVKLKDDHTIDWQNTIGGSLDESLRDIHQTSDGGYIIGWKRELLI